MKENFQYVFKYIIIGDPSVGKSCILNQFLSNTFNEDYDITVGVEFGAKTIKANNRRVKLQIWDTAGQDSFKSITRAYYRASAAAIICYDITNQISFENIESWLEECQSNGNSEMTMVLVGNKVDLEDEREVSFEQGAQFAKKNRMLFFETSAKTSEKVGEIFKQSSEIIFEKIEKGIIDPKNECFGVKKGNKKKIKIPNKKKKIKESSCCN